MNEVRADMSEVPADPSVAVNLAQAQRWNGASGHYWIAHRERHQMIRQRLIPHLWRAAGIAPGDRVLDVGCGCGETTIAAGRATAGTSTTPEREGSVLGIDLSEPMLEVARRLAAEAGVPDVGFVQGDAQVHPFSPGWYDVAISSFGVMFFDDPAAAFANIVAALRPGGRLAFLCWQDDSRNELFAIPLRALAACTRPDQTGADLFADPQQITDLLIGAGCTDIQIEPVTEPGRVGADVPEVVDYVKGMGTFRTMLAELGDPVLVERALASMAEQFAAHQRADGVWVPTAAWLVHARHHPPRSG
jgi:SAM-dependent methyltransferase